MTGPAPTERGGARLGFPFDMFVPMFKEAVAARELTWSLMARDFRVRYRQSVLGVLWAFIPPAAAAAALVLLSRAGVVVTESAAMPYPLYALVGVTIWSVFASGVTAGSESLVAAGSMIVKINFPRSSLVLAAVGTALLDLAIRLPLVVVAAFILDVDVSPTGLLLAVALLFPLFALTLAFAFVLSICVAVFRDARHVLQMALSLCMLLTPVLYPIPEDTPLGRLNAWNPVAHFVVTSRAQLVDGSAPATGYWVASALAVGLLLLCWRLFFLAQRRIAERV